MTQNADQVHINRAAIARLESLIAALPNGERVALRLDDGSEVSGIIAARPVLQVFVDGVGTEGSNAVVRIEPLDPAQSGVSPTRDLWLDRIVSIRQLGPTRSTRSAQVS